MVLALASGKVLQKIFFGQLQPREVEVCFSDISEGIVAKLLPIETVRPNMDVRHRVTPGLHHIPRRVRHSVRHYVRISSVCEVFPLADE